MNASLFLLFRLPPEISHDNWVFREIQGLVWIQLKDELNPKMEIQLLSSHPYADEKLDKHT